LSGSVIPRGGGVTQVTAGQTSTTAYGSVYVLSAQYAFQVEP